MLQAHQPPEVSFEDWKLTYNINLTRQDVEKQMELFYSDLENQTVDSTHVPLLARPSTSPHLYNHPHQDTLIFYFEGSTL